MAQRHTFAQKAQAFEQDRARRSNEERGKLVTHQYCCEIRCQQPGISIWLLMQTPLLTTAAM